MPVFPLSTIPWLAALFFFSGLASLMYQVAWQRLLTLHYGVGPISITLIASVTMLGLGLGSLLRVRIARLACFRPSEEPLRYGDGHFGAVGAVLPVKILDLKAQCGD